MATFKAIVEPHYKRADGTYNIRIRITHNRRSKLISTQLYVTAEDLTRTTLKIKNNAFIEATEDIIKQYRTTCNNIGERLKFMCVDQVVELIKESYNPQLTFDLDFVEYGREVARKMRKAGREGNAKIYDNALNSINRFTGREKIGINEITVKFLQSYVEWLDKIPAPSNRKKGERAVSLYLSTIRAIHNKAKMEYNDEETGVIRIPYSPFVRFKIPKPPVTRKRALEIALIQKIINLPYREDIPGKFNCYNFTRDVFLLSFGLLGMNSADLYNCTRIEAGRVVYQRTKTRNRRADKAEISVRVEPQITALFEKYRDLTGERVFNFYQRYSNATYFNWTLNKFLKEIGRDIEAEDLEFYAARHSWATIARNDAKIDMHTVHSALNHVNEDMKITDIYIKKDYSLIDEANEKVLGLFDCTASNFKTSE